MDIAALKTLIENTPAVAARYDIGDDTGVVALLNLRNQRGPVPLAELSSFTLRTGLMAKVQALDTIPIGTAIDVESGVDMTFAIKGLLKAVISVIQDTSRLTVADLDDANGVAMLDGLEDLNIVTPQIRTAMLALCENRLSLAEINLQSKVSEADVAATRSI